MKRKRRIYVGFVALAVLMGHVSCDDKEEPIVSLERSELQFTECLGEAVSAHGDHFHGLDAGTEGKKVILSFDDKGIAKSPLVELDAKITYKVELKKWDKEGKEVQSDFIKNKGIADQYKAFLVGDQFVLNTASTTESGALFQPREKTYQDGTTVTGKFETTGVLSYFILGSSNKGPNKKVSYVLRELEKGVKETIQRTDWNRLDYSTAFAGKDILKLHFEIKVK